jgi:formate dehydrogenase major subunit
MSDQWADPDPDETESDTVCPRCAVGCRLERGEDHRAVGHSGPVNRNRRLCASGIRAFEQDGERLTQPQVRRDGELVATAWEQAYRRIVDALTGVRDRAGPDALAFLGAPQCTNEENYLLQKLARVLGTNNVDNRSRLCHAETAATLRARAGWPASTNSLDDLREAETILVVGADPAARQPVAFNSYVRPTVDDGATLVHVDPVGSETTRLADIHVAPRPDTDALVCDLLSALIYERDAVDDEFLAARTSESERFLTDLETLDTAAAADVAGVDPERLRDVATAIEGSRTAAITGTGIEGGSETVSAPDALFNLLALTGNLGAPGTGLHVFRGLVNEQGATDAGCVPDRLPGHQPVDDPAVRERFAREWGIEPPESPGRSADEMLAAFGEEIRAAVVVGENPAVSKHDSAWIENRLDGLETLVVLDIAASETTAHADVVLPAARLLEKRGTVTNLDRQVQPLTPVESLPQGARSDFRILRELGARLAERTRGAGDQFERLTPQSAHRELSRLTPIFDWSAVEGKTSYRWPDGQAALYCEQFATPDGKTSLTTVQPVVAAPESNELRLVATGRAGDDRQSDDIVRLHPDEAAEREIQRGDRVVLSNSETFVTGRAEPTENVRPGTVSLHATLADPLLRGDGDTVSVESVASASSGPS